MTTDTDIRHEKRRAAVTLNELAPLVNYYTSGVAVHVVDSVDVPAPPAPAWYTPATGDVTIHLDSAKIDSKSLDSALHGVGWAQMRGLLWHELAHARWSDWMFAVKIPRKIRGTVTMFEEMRIENRAVDKTSGYVRNDIRSVLPLSIGETRSIPPVRSSVARLWALGYGRCLTTVASYDAVQWVDDAARTLLGDDDVDYMTDILQEAITLHMPDAIDRMIELATEWVDLVGDADHDGCGHGDGATEKSDDDDDDDEPGEPGESTGEDADGDGDGGEADGEESEESDGGSASVPDSDKPEPKPKGDSDLGDGVIRDVLDSASPDDDDDDDEDDDFSDEDMSTIIKEVTRMAESIARDWDAPDELKMADPTVEAARVFGSADGKARSTSMEKPGPVEHGEVIRTAKVLETMAIPAITKIPAHKIVPPGRLRSREAVRQSAERSRGALSTAKPWQSTKRTHSHVKPIIVGIATDVSGSMRWAESSVAQFAYVWTHAGQRVGARTASVTFGDRVERVAAPGEILTAVPRRKANGANEKADRALAALDGVLHLSHANNAAKLLVIVSDGMLVIPQETERVLKRLETFKANGTEILWVSNNHVHDEKRYGKVCTVIKIADRSYGASGHAFKKIQDMVLAAITQLSKGQ